MSGTNFSEEKDKPELKTPTEFQQEINDNVAGKMDPFPGFKGDPYEPVLRATGEMGDEIVDKTKYAFDKRFGNVTVSGDTARFLQEVNDGDGDFTRNVKNV